MIRVGIADDHEVVRQGLRQILGAGPCDIVGEAANGGDAVLLARTGRLDVLVLDLSMPGRGGIELIRQIKSEHPGLRILILSMHGEDQYAVRAIKAGAAGYLTKGCAPAELLEAVRKLAAGHLYITPQVAERLALDMGDSGNVMPHKLLSDREYQIFAELVNGKTVTQIATDLSISSKTVSTYKARILDKMRMGSSADLIHYAIAQGLATRH